MWWFFLPFFYLNPYYISLWSCSQGWQLIIKNNKGEGKKEGKRSSYTSWDKMRQCGATLRQHTILVGNLRVSWTGSELVLNSFRSWSPNLDTILLVALFWNIKEPTCLHFKAVNESESSLDLSPMDWTQIYVWLCCTYLMSPFHWIVLLEILRSVS